MPPEMEPNNKTPEKIVFGDAPASVTYSITSKGGYNILFTVRSESGLDLLDKMDAIEKKLTEKEYKPQVKPSFGQKKEIEYVPDKPCPLDNGRLVAKKKADGSIFWTCENNKYDFKTKTSTGCKFICSPENYEQRVAQYKQK